MRWTLEDLLWLEKEDERLRKLALIKEILADDLTRPENHDTIADEKED